MQSFRSILRAQFDKRLHRDENGEMGGVVSLFVGMALAIVVSAYLYIALLGPIIIDLTNSTGTNYIGSGASPLVSAITIMYFLAVFILPIVVVTKLVKE